MAEEHIHPETGKTLTRQVRTLVVRFGSLSERVEVPGWYPGDDSDSIHSDHDLAAWDDALMRLRNPSLKNDAP